MENIPPLFAQIWHDKKWISRLHRDLGEDVVQGVVVRLASSFDHNIAPTRQLVRRTAIWVLKDMLRKRRVDARRGLIAQGGVEPLHGFMEVEDSSGDRASREAENHEFVSWLLNKLNPDQKKEVGHILAGRGRAEIAAFDNISPTIAKNRRLRTLRSLRQMIRGAGFTSECFS